MKRLFTFNIIRTAIFVVVLLAILPAMTIIVSSTFSRYLEELRTADEQGERFVRGIAMRQEQMTEVLETLLHTLGRLREVRKVDAAAASTLFRSLVGNSPEYSNMLLLDKSGYVLATALPDLERSNFSEFPFFKNALGLRSGITSMMGISPFTKNLTLYFAAPVALENGEGAVVVVTLNLACFDKSFTVMPMPEGATVCLLDGYGKLAASYPKPGPAPIGEPLDGGLWSALGKAPGNSGRFIHMNESDGVSASNVTFRKLTLQDTGSPDFYILYMQPVHVAYSRARLVLYHDMTIFAGVTILSLSLAIGLCFFTIWWPWRALLNASSRVGRGELGVRVPENSVNGEIGMLYREFNTMAESLDRRDSELLAARKQAEQSRTAKSEFLANMSHEIRTSMNAILGMAYLVMKTNLTPQQHGYISKLLSAANSLLRIINDILDFSKMEAGKMSMEDISFSLRRILASVRSESAAQLAEKTLRLELQISRDIPDHIIGDPLRLSQALVMLVDDAVNRSERGMISLACSVSEQSVDQVELQFVIRDAGVGLTMAQLAEIRELFNLDAEERPATLDKVRLRLAIANRLFRMMGGGVNISSVFGEGMTFTVKARFGYAAEELRQPEKAFAGKHALIIDGSEISRQDLLEVLNLFGIEAECVDNVDAALVALGEAWERDKPFAVVFLDWRPTTMDMATQIAKLRENSSTTPLVLTTPSGRADLPVSLDELEIDALLPKPLNESLVFDTLMNILVIQVRGSLFPTMEDTYVASGKLGGVKALLVEDNAVNQQIAEEILKKENMELTVVNDGKEAVRLVLENQPGTFDLVLMDIQMPVMDGFAATRAIREHPQFHPLRLPIIAMTAHSNTGEITECFKAGMNDHTSKPIIVDKLLITICRWLPLEKNAAEVLAEILPRLRDAEGKEREALLDKLLPVIYPGRVDWIRDVFAEGNADGIARMFEVLGAITRKESVESSTRT